MKWTYFICLILFLSLGLKAQVGSETKRDTRAMEKIERLEQAKLVEVLNLDEDKAIRFFARRNEFQKSFRNLMKERENLFDILENSIKSKDANESQYNEQVSTILNFETKLAQEKQNFINSLSDLLSPGQIAKYVMFEHKFRRELTQSLMHRQNRNNR